MKTQTKLTQTNDDLNMSDEQLNGLLLNLGLGIERVGLIVAHKMQLDDKWAVKYHAKYKWISVYELNKIRDVGLKKIHPMLMLGGKKAAKLAAKYPFEKQKQYVDGGVTVLSADGKTEKKGLLEIEDDIADQVLGPEGERTVKEQKTFIDSRRHSDNAKRVVVNGEEELFLIRRHTLVLPPHDKTIRFNRKDLLSFLNKMETSR